MRPILLVLDPPDPESLSTRKLILEGQKFNVLTAFTGTEALEIVRRVPVDAVVLHDRVQDGNTAALAKEVKQLRPEVPVWVVSPHPQTMDNVDRALSSFDPLALVSLARDKFGNYVEADHRAAEHPH